MVKIKVLHLTFDMRIGGTEQVIRNLVENADNEHFDNSILCIESPLGPFADDLLAKGITITALSRTPGFDYKLINQIRTYIKQHSIDILHCHQYTPWVYGVLAAFGIKTKVVFTEHGRFYPDSSTWKRKLINPWLHKITAATTAISSATRDALAIYENLPKKDIQVIYNGISPLKIDPDKVEKLRNKLGVSTSALCLGTVARLDPIKNHDMMLHAFKQVLDSGIDAYLLIVGNGEMREHIENLIEELAIQQKVILTGYIPAPKHHLALMDIYLLSSLSEGTSMTLLEAMSIGKPCVVTDAGGNAEIIKQQINGLVTPNNDGNLFADAIITISKDSRLRECMGSKSRKRFQQQFSADAMVDKFQVLYKKITLN